MMIPDYIYGKVEELSPEYTKIMTRSETPMTDADGGFPFASINVKTIEVRTSDLIAAFKNIYLLAVEEHRKTIKNEAILKIRNMPYFSNRRR